MGRYRLPIFGKKKNKKTVHEKLNENSKHVDVEFLASTYDTYVWHEIKQFCACIVTVIKGSN